MERTVFVIEVNLRRRHLNDFQKVELSLPLFELEKERAKQRQEATIPKEGQKGFKPVSGSNEHHTEDGKARDITAKRIGVSPTTYKQPWNRFRSVL